MGTRVNSDQKLVGLGIPERRADRDTLTPTGTGGAGSSDSAYTQAGAGPGQAVSQPFSWGISPVLFTLEGEQSKLTINVSNGQEVPFEVQVRDAGLPSPRVPTSALNNTIPGGVGVVWREQTPTVYPAPSTDDDAWRTRQPPEQMDRWAAARWSDATTFDRIEVLVQTTTQQPVILSSGSGGGTGIDTRLYDFPSSTWVDGPNASIDFSTEVGGGFSAVWQTITGLALDSGRLLAIAVTGVTIKVYATDNLAQWLQYSDDAGSSIFASPDGSTTALYRDDVLLLLSDGPDLLQFVSTDLACRFSPVAQPSLVTFSISDFGRDVHARALPNNGGIAVVYRRFSDDRPTLRILSSAAEPITEATEILVDAVSGSTPLTELGFDVSDNGELVVVGRPTTGDTDHLYVWVSNDGGTTFSLMGTRLVDTGDTATCPTNLRCRFCRGWLITAHNWTATPGNEDGSIGTIWSGGWSNKLRDGTRQDWIPLDLPADVGPWVNGGTTAPTLAPPGVMEFLLAGTNGFVEVDPEPAGDFALLVDHRIDSGTPSLAAFNNGIETRRADGVFDYRIQIRIGAAATRLFDSGAGAPIGSDLVLDGTEWRQWLIVHGPLDEEVNVFYRDQHSTRWVTVLYSYFLTDAGPLASTNRSRVGSAAATTVTSHWRNIVRASTSTSGNRNIGLRFPSVVSLNERDNSVANGAALTQFPNAVPELGGDDPLASDIIALQDTAPFATYISATRGPGRRGETFRVDPFWSGGVTNLFPELSPSPSTPWQALDTSEVRFVWDLGNDTLPAHSWHRYLALLGTNFRQCLLEASNNGTAWTTIGTWDAADGFTGLSYTLVGDTLRPAAGTASGARFLGRNVLAPGGTIANRAGFVILDTGGVPVARPILGNGPGSWQDPTPQDTQYTEIRVGGDLTGIATTGTCDLVFPDGVLLVRVPGVFPATSQFYRYWRIRIPAAQLTGDGAGYRIGARSLGSVAVFGKRDSRGWSQGMTPNTATRLSRFGVRRRRQQGPNRRRWSMNWADGTVLTKIHQATAPNYLAAGGSSAALATVDDVWWTLWALEEETDGWAVPVLALNSIPNEASAMITDRTRFLLGHVDQGAVQATAFLGNVGEDEKVRIDAIAVDESV